MNNIIKSKEITINLVINNINSKKINILYLRYRLSLKNIIQSPLFILTRLFSLFIKENYIDHCCYIYFDNNEFKIFEANIEKGMIVNDLKQRLLAFDGIFYIETLGYINNEKEINFRKKWLYKKYDTIIAGLSGVDGWGGKILNKIFKSKFKKSKTFCSDSVSQFLISQGYDLSNIHEKLSKEITPNDLFYSNLGTKIQIIL